MGGRGLPQKRESDNPIEPCLWIYRRSDIELRVSNGVCLTCFCVAPKTFFQCLPSFGWIVGGVNLSVEFRMTLYFFLPLAILSRFDIDLLNVFTVRKCCFSHKISCFQFFSSSFWDFFFTFDFFLRKKLNTSKCNGIFFYNMNNKNDDTLVYVFRCLLSCFFKNVIFISVQ